MRILELDGPFHIGYMLIPLFPGKQKSQGEKKNTINYHLMRMYPKVVGPQKRDGKLG